MEARLKLISAFEGNLPGSAAHRELLPVSRENFKPNEVDRSSYRESSVAVIFFPENSRLHSILIERAVYEGTHSGQMGFPGGKIESQDKSLVHTAIRECFEETNILLNESHLIGTLTEVLIPVSKFIVQPYVFYLDERPFIVPDPYEVQRVITFEIDELLDTNTLKRKDIRTGSNMVLKNVPYFDIQNNTVWGATALIMSEIRHILNEKY